jgi:cell shape-determining protein MreD
MRSLWLVPLAALLLAIEGALLAFFRVELVRPDPVLVMVVALAFHPDPAALASLLALGFVADSMAGAPAGLSACVYLAVFGLTRVALRFLVPERRAVRLGVVFAASLAATVLLGLLWGLGPAGGEWTARIWLWAVPLGLWNCLLAAVLWAPVRRLVAGPARAARAGLA